MESPRVALFSPRPKLGEEVTRYLRDAIMTGEYSGGQRIRVEELAGRLDVSTMPVREALTALVNEGLLEALPRRGYRVATLHRRDIEDVFRVHAFVAGILAERSVAAVGDDDIARLRAMQRRVEQVARQRATIAHRATQIEEVNYQFHRTINRMADSPRLRWFLRAATRYVPRHFYHQIPAWTDTTIRDHPTIIDALESHDATRARKVMEEHILRAGRLVADHLAAKGLALNQ